MTKGNDTVDNSQEETLAHSVSLWLVALKDGSERAAEELWSRYYERMVYYCRRKLPFFDRRLFDSEDVAISAFHSLCNGISDGRFPQLRDRESLWALVSVITARKLFHQIRHNSAQKRDSRALISLDDSDVAGAAPPDLSIQVEEELEYLLSILPEPALKEIARLKAEGKSNEEIAEAQSCGKRTIERRLELVRRIWTHDLQKHLD